MAIDNREELLKAEMGCKFSDRQCLLLTKSGFSVSLYDAFFLAGPAFFLSASL